MEARRCGAPTIAARTSSLVELLPDDDALFDPRRRSRSRSPSRKRSPTTASGAASCPTEPRPHLGRGRRRHGRLVPATGAAPEVAAADARAAPHRRAHATAARAHRCRRVLPTGCSSGSARIAAVEAFTTNPRDAQVPEGVGLHLIEHIGRAQAGRIAFGTILHCWGNSRFHVPLLPAIRDWPGSCWPTTSASPVCTSGPAGPARARRRYVPGRARPDVRRRAAGRTGDAASGHLPRARSPRGHHGAREVVGWASAPPHPPGGRRRDGAAGRPLRTATGSAWCPSPSRGGRPRRRRDRLGSPPLVASFGVVQASKGIERLIEAFALVHVADLASGWRSSARSPTAPAVTNAVADRLGIGAAVLVTGRILSSSTRTGSRPPTWRSSSGRRGTARARRPRRRSDGGCRRSRRTPARPGRSPPPRSPRSPTT